MSVHTLHAAALLADTDYGAALVAAYGAEACNARYDQRGEATPHLRALARRKVETYDAFRLAAFGC